ncbi:hypothetical protein LS68_009425 [Helicobacter sp. MIT 05-5293]|uniref:hypothetical protein n=1 Tax=Helicobacter sp. MIT 05-5293 TaxID=1548149 RepID=UPI00051E0C19|nr:hypothetical protein [Helicobacter sp. MIT 05-5293]TLD79806.1 hypothetical protein LS68_009425 [Helicobacter sp. MIT 05-5293]
MKNIIHRVYAFFFSLLALSLLSIIFFTSNEEIHQNIGKEVPNIEINDFTLYLINSQYFQSFSYGAKAMRYNDHEEIYDLFVEQYNPQSANEFIYAPFVVNKEGRYTFSQGANYLREDGLHFWSEDGTYDYNNRIFQGKGAFHLINNTADTKGINIFYNAFSNEVRADNIKADIQIGRSF